MLRRRPVPAAQCGGPDLVGWNWEAVEGEESLRGTTWGEYTVVGTWDGERITLTTPPEAAGERNGPTAPTTTTPCAPPPGGWAVVDPSTATSTGEEAAINYSRRQPDFAGIWQDHSLNPATTSVPLVEEALNDPALMILNVRFTADLERHEAELRARWGGSLCVTGAERSLSDLEGIRREVESDVDFLSSGINESSGTVRITVAFDDGSLQREVDRRYGPGAVAISSALELDSSPINAR